MAKEIWTPSEMGKKGGTRRAELHSDKEIAEWGARGGKNRAARHSRRELRAWGKAGGRPPALTPAQAQRIAEWTRQGVSQEIIAQRLGISTRTVARYLQRFGDNE